MSVCLDCARAQCLVLAVSAQILQMKLWTYKGNVSSFADVTSKVTMLIKPIFQNQCFLYANSNQFNNVTEEKITLTVATKQIKRYLDINFTRSI